MRTLNVPDEHVTDMGVAVVSQVTLQLLSLASRLKLFRFLDDKLVSHLPECLCFLLFSDQS